MGESGEQGIQRWAGDAIRLTWSPAARLMEMSFLRAGHRSTGAQADEFIEQIERWTGGSSERFAILVDCALIEDADAAWRQRLNGYFRERAGVATVAWYNTTVAIRVMVEMFAMATPGFTGKAFEAEAEAREYMAGLGFA